MRAAKSSKKVPNLLVIVKLILAVCLLALAWTNMPVQADEICDGANLSSTCVALMEGGASCQELNDMSQSDRVCMPYELPGGGSGCLNTICYPPNDHGPAPTRP